MSTTPLDHFEQSLLTELRHHVADRAGVRRPRRRVAALAAAVVTAGSVGAAALLLHPDPAFAVDTAPGGDVVVTIKSLDDAAGLERALAEHGVEAQVSHDGAPVAVERAPGGAPAGAPGGAPDGTAAPAPEVAPLPCGTVAVGGGDGGVSFRLPAAAVRAGVPLRIQTGAAADGWSSSLTVFWEKPVC